MSARHADSLEVKCVNCGYYTDANEPCGGCGLDPEEKHKHSVETAEVRGIFPDKVQVDLSCGKCGSTTTVDIRIKDIQWG